jgi:HK97 family phage major capsid protein
MKYTAIDLQRQIEQKTGELREMAVKAQSGKLNADGAPEYNWTAEQLGEFKSRKEELDGLNVQFEQIVAVEAALKGLPATRNNDMPLMGARTEEKQFKTLGEMFVGNVDFKSTANRKKLSFEMNDVDVKTLMQTSVGFAPANPRTDVVILSAQRRPMIADLIPQDTTMLSAIKYMEETTFTNNSDTVAEAAQYPENALAFTERTSSVQKIAAFLPVTDEQLDDVPSLQNYINQRLMLMLQLKEETQILSGDGNSPNLTGILNATGLQTQALGADPVQDAIMKAFTLVRHTGYAEPSGVIMHPNDWQVVRLATTADGLYIWGNPSENGVERVWGKPVIVTTAQTENTALVGDFTMYTHISRRLGVQIDVSDSHSDYFIKGKLAIRIQERLSLEIYRGAAFCKVTGI